MVPQISAAQLHKALEQQKNITLLDVRFAEEFQFGKIATPIHIPLPELEQRYTELNKNNEIIVYCRSGGRSASATRFLVSKGYNAKNLVGGILGYKKFDDSITEY